MKFYHNYQFLQNQERLRSSDFSWFSVCPLCRCSAKRVRQI